MEKYNLNSSTWQCSNTWMLNLIIIPEFIFSRDNVDQKAIIFVIRFFCNKKNKKSLSKSFSFIQNPDLERSGLVWQLCSKKPTHLLRLCFIILSNWFLSSWSKAVVIAPLLHVAELIKWRRTGKMRAAALFKEVSWKLIFYWPEH